MSILFNPLKIGAIEAKNRILMAPVSRNRAPQNGVPSEFAVEYYKQRAQAGLIIAESTEINSSSGGMDAPGIYSSEQIARWREITDAVHAEGGLIFLQIWHSGRITHSSLLPGNKAPLAPSAIRSSRELMTAEGMQQVSMPREASLQDIEALVEDHRNAAINALEAGFDGIELHAANGYLIDQFLQDCTNHRKDQYGGSINNRMRFLKEILEAISEVWPSDRIGIRLSPTSKFNDMMDSNRLGHFGTIFDYLNTVNLAYLHVVEELPWIPASEEDRAIVAELREKWQGVYIANGCFDDEKAQKAINEGQADAVTFGRNFVANPDLPTRYEQNAPLNPLDESTLYGGGQQGYTDYPFLQDLTE